MVYFNLGVLIPLPQNLRFFFAPQAELFALTAIRAHLLNIWKYIHPCVQIKVKDWLKVGGIESYVFLILNPLKRLILELKMPIM